ncbi:MAG: hypothetical protein FJ087_17135 [Deltaproteobacteria bacterium]|nr:hypothetical protein [Deltaproteobacteria bacterium]
MRRALVLLPVLVACDGTAFDPQQQPPKPTDVLGEAAGADAPADAPQVEAADPGGSDAAPDTAPEAAPDADPDADPDAFVKGCTDPEAKNHDPAATEDDGSCLYDVSVTFHVDMSCVGDAPAPQVAGGNTFGDPGDFPLSDPDQDGIWTATVALAPGLGTSYTFTSDACAGFTCKEDIAGQSCATEPWNDRYLAVGATDLDVRACFGRCEVEVCGQCPKGASAPAPIPTCATPQVKVTFRVDLAASWPVAQSNVIALRGGWAEPGSGAGPGPGIVMARLPPPDHTVYEAAVCLDPDTQYTYKFIGLTIAALTADEFPDGAYAAGGPPCPGTTATKACDAGTCTSRVFTTGKSDQVLPVVPWAGCPAD